MPHVYEELEETPSCAWPAASVAAHMYFAVEDYILEKWLDIALKHVVGHCSMHFDGLRLQRETVAKIVQNVDLEDLIQDATDDENFCNECSARIRESTSYIVSLHVK